MAEVDELVWTLVLALLEDPTLIEAEIERRLAMLRAAHPASQRRDGLQRDLARAQSAVRRLIDGYQEQLITLEELRARTPELRAREATLQAQLDALDTELHDAATYLKLTETLEGFRARLLANAHDLTVEQRQQIVRIVVREALIGDDDITIRHSVPTPTGDQPPGSLLRWDSREGPDPSLGPHRADLPILPGTPERATHDYKRDGTSSLYATLDITTGKAIGALHGRHRAIEFKEFLQTFDREVPAEVDVHLVLDNVSTHKTPVITRWLQAHPRFVLHFTPTSRSWLNLVERWFSELTTKKLRRGAHRSTRALNDDIRAGSRP